MRESMKRTAYLIGENGIELLTGKHVAVFGIGGVGGYVAEALGRTGIGTLTLVDKDTVSESNINRQIIATYDTIGTEKTKVMEERLRSVNPEVKVIRRDCFFLPETADSFDFSDYDYVVDAVDTVTAKLELIERAQAVGVPIISCMGTGNKLDPSRFEIADISKTSVCPLAKVMRRELKKRGILHQKVLYSKEEPLSPMIPEGMEEPTPAGVRAKAVPGSIAFVPSVAGFMIAAEVIKDLLKEEKTNGKAEEHFSEK
ncbi:MAG: tRNA threonylcarbamoyladenosine dehydratase [Lachnospiraceae bacterium]|nr:tRNA threonylcarbamoyladenosine dehydratase [Lachnospiraceae bacterium]